jgi:hypothetical protein
MFDNNLFIVNDERDDLSTTLLRSLGEGTEIPEIEEMKASEVVRLWDIVKDRLEKLTHLLTQNPYFILAYRRDGVIQMTDKFARLWKNRECYWEDGFESSQTDRPKPAKKRKKSKAVRAKTPLVFPTLSGQDDTMMEYLSAQVDVGSRMQLATMAETALELSGEKVLKCDRLNPETGEPRRALSKRKYNTEHHIETIHEEGGDGSVVGREPSQSRLSEFMVSKVVECGRLCVLIRFILQDVVPELETDGPAPQQTFSRSVSPADSIGAESRTTEKAKSPNITPLFPLPPQNQATHKQVSRSTTMETTPCLDGPNKRTSILKVPMPMLSQSLSPTESTASQSPERSVTTFVSVLHSQHYQPRPTGGEDSASAFESKWHAEFSWLDTQNPKAATAPSTNASSTYGEAQGSSTAEHNKHVSPHPARKTKDVDLEYDNHHNSAFSTPGSSISLPLEIVDDSDSRSTPSTPATKPSSIRTNTPSSQTCKPTNEFMKETTTAGVQLKSESPSSPKTMSLLSMLNGEADYRVTNSLCPPHFPVEKHNGLSTSPPQSTSLQLDPPTSVYSVHTGSSPTAQLSSAQVNTRELSHAPSPGQRHQQRTMTSAEPLASDRDPSSTHHRSSEPTQSPISGGMVKRKAGTWPFRAVNDIQSPTNAAGHYKDCAQDSESPTPNSSSITPGFKSLLPQGCEPVQKPAAESSATHRSPSQVGDDVQLTSAASPLPKPTNRSPVEKIIQPQTFGESHLPPRSTEPRRSPDALSSTVATVPSSPTMSTSTLNHNNHTFVSPVHVSQAATFSRVQTCQAYQNSGLLILDRTFTKGQAATNQSPHNPPSQPKSPVPCGTASQVRNSTVNHNMNPPSPATKSIQCHSPSEDFTPRPEKRVALSIQKPATPPSKGTPHRRNGSYSFVPPPEAFSPYQPSNTLQADTLVPSPVVLSTDTRLATTSNPSGTFSTPTLTLLIDSADGSMILDTTHSFEIVENSSLSEFFQFYSSISAAPLSSLTSLEFQPAFGKRPSYKIRRYGGEDQWKRLKEVIPSLFEKAVRRDRGGRTEWLVLVSSE